MPGKLLSKKLGHFSNNGANAREGPGGECVALRSLGRDRAVPKIAVLADCDSRSRLMWSPFKIGEVERLPSWDELQKLNASSVRPSSSREWQRWATRSTASAFQHTSPAYHDVCQGDLGRWL
jgi:hypothetical protein